MKKVDKADQEMFKPLLLGDESGGSANPSPRSRTQTLRVTPKNLMTKEGGDKTPKNPLKQ